MDNNAMNTKPQDNCFLRISAGLASPILPATILLAGRNGAARLSLALCGMTEHLAQPHSPQFSLGCTDHLQYVA